MSSVSANLQAVFWVILAGGVAFYGDGEHDLLTLVATDPKLNRRFINAALVSLSVNMLLFAYAYLWLEGIRRVDHAITKVKWIVPAGALTFAVTIICFIVGLWPTFSILALPIVIVQTFGCIMALHFAPTLGFLRVKKRHAD